MVTIFLYVVPCPIYSIELNLYRVSKNVPPLACYNFDTREWILTFFGSSATDKVRNQKTHYYATSNNLSCITWQNGKHENCIFHLLY